MEKINVELREIFEALKTAQIQSVTVTYSGSGDEGVVDEIECTPDQDLPAELETRIENVAYSLLETNHSGWEDANGSSGTFEFQVENSNVHHEHTEYYTEADTSESNYQV